MPGLRPLKNLRIRRHLIKIDRKQTSASRQSWGMEVSIASRFYQLQATGIVRCVTASQGSSGVRARLG